MIYTTLENAERYFSVSSGIKEVIDFARGLKKEEFQKGRVDIDGDRVYMNLAEYETHPREGAPAEAHRKYIDVMVMVEGEETVYVKPASRLRKVTREYDESIEALLADTDEDAFGVRLGPNDVLILFPEDAHSPACFASGESHVKKIIGKVMV